MSFVCPKPAVIAESRLPKYTTTTPKREIKSDTETLHIQTSKLSKDNIASKSD